MLERALIVAFLFAFLSASGCSQEPAEVFVPGPGFAQLVRISTVQGESARVRVGEPLILHGERSSGPWIQVEKASLTPDACWLVSPPEPVEAEVAGNLRWIVEPEGEAEFDLGLRGDMTRTVTFRRPGVYRLSAQSGAWCRPTKSENTLTVTVAPQ